MTNHDRYTHVHIHVHRYLRENFFLARELQTKLKDGKFYTESLGKI